jgi:hypothetical protein
MPIAIIASIITIFLSERIVTRRSGSFLHWDWEPWVVERTGVRRYRFRADAKDTNLAGITNPVQISLSVGDNAGLTSVKAR